MFQAPMVHIPPSGNPNLLLPACLGPRLFADAFLDGQFDFNKNPLASRPPGTKIFVYEDPDNRGSWSDHGVDGWYVGGVPEYYYCYCVYIPSPKPNASYVQSNFSS